MQITLIPDHHYTLKSFGALLFVICLWVLMPSDLDGSFLPLNMKSLCLACHISTCIYFSYLWYRTSAGTRQFNNRRLIEYLEYATCLARLGTAGKVQIWIILTSNTSQAWGLCREDQQQCGRRLSPPGDCTRPPVERPQSGREGCWRKLRPELDLLKGEDDVARDKVDAPKPKRRLLEINEADDDSDGERKMDEFTRFWNLNICKRIS